MGTVASGPQVSRNPLAAKVNDQIDREIIQEIVYLMDSIDRTNLISAQNSQF